MTAANERCEGCGKSTAGDAGADQIGPHLCYTCRTDRIEPNRRERRRERQEQHDRLFNDRR